jgi:hypothetical protein
MNRLDLLHDRSHVRQYRPSEWHATLEAVGYVVEACQPYERSRALTSLTAGVDDEDAAEIHRVVSELDEDQRRALGVEDIDGVLHTTHWYVMLAAVKPS